MGGGHEAYDAELAALAHGLVHLYGRSETGQAYTIFTDSTAAIGRIVGDAPGPDQEMAIRIIELAQRIVDQGNSITVRWTPAHMGVEGNERADQAAKDAASLPPLRARRRHFSLAFLRRATEWATQAWRRDIEKRSSGRRSFRLPTVRSQPGIRPPLAGSPKEHCS